MLIWLNIIYDASPNIAECFKCNFYVCEWWEILQVGPLSHFGTTKSKYSKPQKSWFYLFAFTNKKTRK